MPEELAAEVGLHAPPVEETPPPAVETPPPAADPPKPAEDVEGIKGALVAERRRRQELEQELAVARTPPPVVPRPEVAQVSDDQAEKFARRYELYTANGLDLARAKQMIADNQKEIEDVARRTAQEVIEPLKQTTAVGASRQNFVWAASQTDADGQPLVDPRALAEVWATFPPELSANPEVAKVILKATVGEAVMTRKSGPKPAMREPLQTEAPGGFRGNAYTMSNVEKKTATAAGIASADWEKRAKTYQPGQPNTLE